MSDTTKSKKFVIAIPCKSGLHSGFASITSTLGRKGAGILRDYANFLMSGGEPVPPQGKAVEAEGAGKKVIALPCTAVSHSNFHNWCKARGREAAPVLRDYVQYLIGGGTLLKPASS